MIQAARFIGTGLATTGLIGVKHHTESIKL